MKLSVRSLALTSGLLWGGSMLSMGLINLLKPSYGKPFLKMMSSVYPGFHNSGTVTDVLVGMGYGFLDGVSAGAMVAVLYNQLICEKAARGQAQPVQPPQPAQPVHS